MHFKSKSKVWIPNFPWKTLTPLANSVWTVKKQGKKRKLDYFLDLFCIYFLYFVCILRDSNSKDNIFHIFEPLLLACTLMTHRMRHAEMVTLWLKPSLGSSVDDLGANLWFPCQKFEFRIFPATEAIFLWIATFISTPRLQTMLAS